MKEIYLKQIEKIKNNSYKSLLNKLSPIKNAPILPLLNQNDENQLRLYNLEFNPSKQIDVLITEYTELSLDEKLNKYFDRKIYENRKCLVQDLYLKICKKCCVAPIKKFKQKLMKKNVYIPHRYMGSNSIKPVAACLQNGTTRLLDIYERQVYGPDYANTPFSLSHLDFGRNLSVPVERLFSPYPQNAKTGQLFKKGWETDKYSKIKYILNNALLGNNINDLTGSKYIAKLITKNESIKKLNFSMNGFGICGGMYMGMLISNNEFITHLNLNSNRINSEGVKKIISSISQLKQLTKLKLAYNPITPFSAAALITEIECVEYCVLDYLDIRGVPVFNDFLLSLSTIQMRKHKFKCKHGLVVSKLPNKIGYKETISDVNPLEVLLIYMTQKNMRLVDLFKTLDKDQSMSLSRDEFIQGLKDIETPLSQDQLDELIDMLDKDKDGEVDYQEIMNINKEFRNIKLKAVRKVTENKRKQKELKERLKRQKLLELMQ
ncbi:hypothetical protein A3Q56_01003 [Intoshia linei]|uniref:EF-hand domain-containing protein n=1 Tax=Intoshia linei TaxID=1819745 RepID=A0A177BA74_9BILA|nr:hypothetical protein A3Q56_01003 [Intoshia linei]